MIDVPAVDVEMQPGDQMELSCKILIDPYLMAGDVRMYVFRFYSDKEGYFGEPLVATVQVVPAQGQIPRQYKTVVE